MAEAKRIEIRFKKEKLYLGLFGSILFILLGIWIYYKKTSQEESMGLYRQLELYFLFYIGLPFFGFAFVFLLKKIIDRKPALIFDKIGLTDNSNGTSIGIVYWHDVINIEKTQFKNQNYICVFVQNPDDYLNKETNYFKRKLIFANLKLMGTPITLHTGVMSIDDDELMSLIIEYWQGNKKRSVLDHYDESNTNVELK